MKNNILYICFFALAILFASCEDLDTAFQPQNPQLSEDAVKGVPNSAQKLLVGCERQLTLSIDEIVVISEIATDNYQNTQTFYNQFLDNLDIDNTDADIDDTQGDFHRLRELALAGLNEIGPADPNFDAEQEAEFNFMAGFSHLLSAMYFKTLPNAPGEAAAPSETHYNVAIGYFDTALGLTSKTSTIASCQLGKARANYFLGNKADAVSAANAAIAADPAFVRYAEFDAINTPTNNMQNALYDRGTFDDLQPLPKLDFLDPKYNGEDATKDVNVPILKIEEAHLILTEAAISDGNLDNAKSIMKDILVVVSDRPTLTFDDAREGRTHDAPRSRPDTSVVSVAADAKAPLRDGLVINRQVGDVTIPVVSGTSATPDMIDALASTDEALEALYLMRQEIFIAEGIRFVDLGIKLVVSQTEDILNEKITDEDLVPVIPPFIDAIKTELDAFTYDQSAFTATIMHNVNAILVANKGSDLVVPFE